MNGNLKVVVVVKAFLIVIKCSSSGKKTRVAGKCYLIAVKDVSRGKRIRFPHVRNFFKISKGGSIKRL